MSFFFPERMDFESRVNMLLMFGFGLEVGAFLIAILVYFFR